MSHATDAGNEAPVGGPAVASVLPVKRFVIPLYFLLLLSLRLLYDFNRYKRQGEPMENSLMARGFAVAALIAVRCSAVLAAG
ncbi:MAG: hypothetical protein LBN38_04755, partial [Verrucomicrobiota bacterium]|nr:hypothetical protein [Verrucomicrobiota bacterium]